MFRLQKIIIKWISNINIIELSYSYVVFQTDYFNVNKGGYIKLRTVAVTVLEPWLALSYQNDC
jgi:hypothetical protein